MKFRFLIIGFSVVGTSIWLGLKFQASRDWVAVTACTYEGGVQVRDILAQNGIATSGLAQSGGDEITVHHLEKEAAWQVIRQLKGEHPEYFLSEVLARVIGSKRFAFGSPAKIPIQLILNPAEQIGTKPKSIFFIFPQGRSDERFTVLELTYGANVRRSGGSQFFLQYSTGAPGSTQCRWTVGLSKLGPPSPPNSTTLAAKASLISLLAKSNLQIVGIPDDSIKSRLYRNDGYAVYAQPATSSASIRFWFTDKGGVRSRIRSATAPRENSASAAFPMTMEEREAARIG